MNERLLNPEETSNSGPSLRPRSLQEFIGQRGICEKLQLFIQAAQQREDILDHVLLAGPPGLGKTTLAQITAKELGAQVFTLTGPNVEKKGDLAAILTQLQRGDVLFIDEIHRLQRAIEEVLYSAMEDFKLDVIIGQGPGAKTIQIKLPPFTLIGATTRTGLLTNPLRDRFGVQLRLSYYPESELIEVIQRGAKVLNVQLDLNAAREIAKCSRGTPRVALRLLKRIRDYFQVKGKGQSHLEQKMTREALDLFEIDDKGLDPLDQNYLLTLIEKFEGGPVGIETLCAAIGEERDTLEDNCEPFLLQRGFIQRTPRGRMATSISYQHFGKKDPRADKAPELALDL